MNAAELVARARAQVGRGTRYRLGGGRTKGPDPRDEMSSCDCSAFVCWCLGLGKYQPDFAWLRKLNGGWLNTDGIWWDASREPTGFFSAIQDPAPGAIVVYPSAATSAVAGPAIGHVGIVVSGGPGYRVVHCSSGNYTRHGDAIRETGPEVFRRKATIFAWASPIERVIP